jgi:hypothetical protein
MSATLYLSNGADVLKEIPITTIGHERILTFPAETVSSIRLIINNAKATASISEIETYFIDENLIEK